MNDTETPQPPSAGAPPEDPGKGDVAASPGPPVVMFGYLPGFTDGVKEGFRVGRFDLEREKSEAAADGFRRGKRAAEAFLPGAEPKASRLEVLLWGAAIGVLIGAALEKRKREKIEEVAADELPDVRD